MDLKKIARWTDNNSPAILAATAVFGVLSTFVMVARAAPKAELIIDAEKRFREEEGNLPEVDILDKVELTWRVYWPSVASAAVTIACILGANHISTRRNAALISLVGVAESALREYQERVVETIGEAKEEKIRASIAEDHIKQNPPTSSMIIISGKGNYPCYDEFSKRWFMSNIEILQRAEIKFNQQLNKDTWLNINYLYDLFGLDPIPLGTEYGWTAMRDLLELRFYPKQVPETGEPALVVDYRVAPHHI